MKILLDSHFLLWWLDDSAELGAVARKVIAEPENLVFFSAVSLWELRIKEGLGKVVLPPNLREVLALEQFESLSVNVRHTDELKDLPLHHRDPFDRMLIAQARVEGLTLLTRDKFIPHYEVEVLTA